MDCYGSGLFLSDIRDDELLGVFTISIEDDVVSEVDEGVHHSTECLCQDEANLCSSGLLIKIDQLLESD
jgi:hypothetical protein